MQLTPQTQHAPMSMLVLAEHEENIPSEAEPSYIPLYALSKRISISVSYLEQLFRLLRRAELVSSLRGPNGGYRLAKPADRITLAAVARAVNPERRADSDHPQQRLLEKVNFHIDHFLETLTLRDVLLAPVRHDAEEHARAEQAA